MSETIESGKPEGEIQVGKEKDESAGAEVAGRGKKSLLYTCYNCGAGNYIDPNSDPSAFSCWRCGNIHPV
jgi:predicted RNA-binding Zn-ribbon protein involved in translation (DUF1610 family)